MEFLALLDRLEENYPLEKRRTEHYAVLYGVEQTPPLQAKHILFDAMTDQLITDLTGSYQRVFPGQLLELYRRINGAELFWGVRHLPRAKLSIPGSRLSVFGIPLETSRKYVEPYDIRIEDLARACDTPASWVKFGSWRPGNDFRQMFDLFADTDSGKVYAVDRAEISSVIQQQWDSVDLCLCDIFNKLAQETGI